MQACLSAQRCHDGRSHALLEYVGLAAIVWRAVCSRKRRWNGVPPRAGPFGRRRFFRGFSAHFCATLEHIFFQWKRQKSVHQKSAHQKSAQKSGAKICAPKICTKKRFESSVCLEDGSQKKKTQENLRQTCLKPQPQWLDRLEFAATISQASVFLCVWPLSVALFRHYT